MRCFGDVSEKNFDVDVFDDVLQNAKHRAYDASNDVNRPPLMLRAKRANGGKSQRADSAIFVK